MAVSVEAEVREMERKERIAALVAKVNAHFERLEKEEQDGEYSD